LHPLSCPGTVTSCMVRGAAKEAVDTAVALLVILVI
jgi:hypothetical protein